eukprot:gene7504-1342_t
MEWGVLAGALTTAIILTAGLSSALWFCFWRRSRLRATAGLADSRGRPQEETSGVAGPVAPGIWRGPGEVSPPRGQGFGTGATPSNRSDGVPRGWSEACYNLDRSKVSLGPKICQTPSCGIYYGLVTELGVTIVVKKMPRSQDTSSKLKREIDINAKYHHDNIVQAGKACSVGTLEHQGRVGDWLGEPLATRTGVSVYLGFDEDSRWTYIYMEYVAAGTLHDQLVRFGRLPEVVVSQYSRQLLQVNA